MLYTLGRVFFPMMIHREKALRVRMRWLAVGSGLILMLVVGAVFWRVQQQRPGSSHQERPLEKDRVRLR
jgi:hypothetical protein